MKTYQSFSFTRTKNGSFISIVLILFVILFASCQQKPKEASKEPEIDPKILVSCEGIGEVKSSDSHESLEKKFGANALSEHTNSVLGSYTTVWDADPRQVNIYWKEESAPFIHIDYMETVSPESPYVSKSGLSTGMLLKDITKINSDMPLTFHNPYATEGRGVITSFNNGAIATTDPCVGGRVEVSKSRNVDVPTLASFSNETIIESSHSLLSERIDMVFAAFRISAEKK